MPVGALVGDVTTICLGITTVLRTVRDVNVKRRTKEYIRDYPCSYRTSSFNNDGVSIYEYATFSLISYVFCSLREWGYFDITRHSSKVIFLFFLVVMKAIRLHDVC